MNWFQDALLVNVGATGMRPDPRKVGSLSTLTNALVVMLKLCEPFVGYEKKQHLIDPGYVSSPKDHGGVYASGEDGVPRLGDSVTSSKEYAPKNAFIPQCFFLCARFIHLGYAHQFGHQMQLMRHIQHLHWEAHNNNRNLETDDTYMRLISAQRSHEVTLFQEELVTDTLRFCNLMAKILFEMDDDTLKLMPEHFVNDTCDVVMGVAKLKPKALRGLEFRYVFKLVVKLLSPKYAGVCNLCLILQLLSLRIFSSRCRRNSLTNFTFVGRPQLQSTSHAGRYSLRSLFAANRRPSGYPVFCSLRPSGRWPDISFVGRFSTRVFGTLVAPALWRSRTHWILRQDVSPSENCFFNQVPMGEFGASTRLPSYHAKQSKLYQVCKRYHERDEHFDRNSNAKVAGNSRGASEDERSS
mgnify:CR=1 FL=1